MSEQSNTPRLFHSHYRIAFVDTDAGGVVYHSRYLDFAERARGQMLHDLGTSNAKLMQDGIVFALRRVQADYHAPAKLDDLLEIETELTKVGGASLEIKQVLLVAGQVKVTLQQKLACLTTAGRPTRMPGNLVGCFEQK